MEENTAVVETEETPAPVEAPEVEATETPVDGAETSSEPEAAPEPEAGPVETPEEKANRAINDKIARHKRAAERAQLDIEYWKEKATKGGQPEPAAPAAPTEPSIDQYETYDDFIVAKAEYAAEKKYNVIQQQRAAQNQRQAHETKVKGLISKGVAAHPDFNEVVNPSTPVSEIGLATATTLKNGSEVLYYLGSNPQEAERITTLNPVEQVIELKSISDRISAAPAKKQSKAPDPIDPITTTTGAGELKYHPDMSQADYAKLRAQRKKAAA